jgi:hypothetical protein
MAIIYTRPSGSVNPTSTFLPVNIGGTFENSSIKQDSRYQTATELTTVDNLGNSYGFKVDYTNQAILMGDFDGINFGTSININDLSAIINISANLAVGITCPDPTSTITLGAENFNFSANFIRLNGSLLSGTASGASGQHLKINVNGTNYKISLLNP